ncbi:MAG: FtsX-like permease family protein, partial [Acidobacteriia bacterium]|nr:FtsX-like permease family protein [Terriglobia bacterium]
MTRSQLVTRNLLRNRRRTFLTVASVSVSIFLLVIFGATIRYLDAPPGADRWYLVLFVGPRTSLMQPLPLSYQARIARLPGVASVTPLNWFDAHYGGEQIMLPTMACDPETILTLFDWNLPQEQRQAFVREKVAFVVGRKVAQKYRWKVGDHVTLHSPGYNISLDLVLRGIYSSKDEESNLAFHWDYLNEALGRPNKPGAFWVLARTPDDAARLMKEIDALFHNEDVETRTQTMKQFMLDFLGMLGNVKLILLSISAAVVFAVLLIVANTMAMSIRERTSELAVLRALGFRTRQVLGFLTAESLALSLTGTAAGCLGAWILCALIRGYRVGGMMPMYIQLSASTVGLALGVAVGISLLSTLLPAYRASHG